MNIFKDYTYSFSDLSIVFHNDIIYFEILGELSANMQTKFYAYIDGEPDNTTIGRADFSSEKVTTLTLYKSDGSIYSSRPFLFWDTECVTDLTPDEATKEFIKFQNELGYEDKFPRNVGLLQKPPID